MNWSVIGILIVFISVLISLLLIAIYSILRLKGNMNRLMYYLNYYKELSNKYGLQLTRIDELIEAFEELYKNARIVNTSELLSNIKSLAKIVGR